MEKNKLMLIGAGVLGLIALIAFVVFFGGGSGGGNSKQMDTNFGQGNNFQGANIDQSEKNTTTTDSSRKIDSTVDTSSKN